METQRNTPVFLRNTTDDSHLFKPLPHPTGTYPYRLDLRHVVGKATWFMRHRMSFQMVGDTGSLRHSAFQEKVVAALAQQAGQEMPIDKSPAFLYHLGDLVYNHGEASQYPKQFLVPYERYPKPVFAIAGNHDGDVNPDNELVYQSLDAFMDVFCDTYQRKILFGHGTKRRSMIQPHVYWTLETPLVRFIGLYGNVTKHGTIDPSQYRWFVEELAYAREYFPDQALVVCVHHAPYSADTNHGSSASMIATLDRAFAEAGNRPHLVVSGHVHNYQRFVRTYEDGTQVPFVVAGAGGYVDLHRIAKADDPRVRDDDPLLRGVTLENYCDSQYGFLRFDAARKGRGVSLVGSYYAIPESALAAGARATAPVLFDQFAISTSRREQTDAPLETSLA